MANVTIIRPDGSTLTFDSVREYTVTPTVTVTEHPVESGSAIADHARANPDLLAVRAVVTESPFDRQDSAGGPDRPLRAFDFLRACVGELVSVVTDRLGTFPSMTITRFPTTVDRMRRLPFDVEFKAVRLAEAGLITIAPDTPVATDPSSGFEVPESIGLPDEQDVGEQPTTTTEESEPAQEEADTSVLLDLLTAVGAEP